MWCCCYLDILSCPWIWPQILLTAGLLVSCYVQAETFYIFVYLFFKHCLPQVDQFDENKLESGINILSDMSDIKEWRELVSKATSWCIHLCGICSSWSHYWYIFSGKYLFLGHITDSFSQQCNCFLITPLKNLPSSIALSWSYYGWIFSVLYMFSIL